MSTHALADFQSAYLVSCSFSREWQVPLNAIRLANRWKTILLGSPTRATCSLSHPCTIRRRRRRGCRCALRRRTRRRHVRSSGWSLSLVYQLVKKATRDYEALGIYDEAQTNYTIPLFLSDLCRTLARESATHGVP